MFRFFDFSKSPKTLFYPFEEKLINAVRSGLSDEGGKFFARQLSCINKIQRHSGGKEVNLYQIINGKSIFPDELRFPYAVDESKLANVVLSDPSSNRTLKAQVWLVKGRIFSITFNESPIKFFGTGKLKGCDLEATEVQILVDPMLIPIVAQDSAVGDIQLHGWAAGWQADGFISGLKLPSPQLDQASCLKGFDVKFPSDYLELITQTDGADFPNGRIFGLNEIREVVSSNANYLVIAEIFGEGVFALHEGCQDGVVYFLDFEDDLVQTEGDSLATAIVRHRTGAGPAKRHL